MLEIKAYIIFQRLLSYNAMYNIKNIYKSSEVKIWYVHTSRI